MTNKLLYLELKNALTSDPIVEILGFSADEEDVWGSVNPIPTTLAQSIGHSSTDSGCTEVDSPPDILIRDVFTLPSGLICLAIIDGACESEICDWDGVESNNPEHIIKNVDQYLHFLLPRKYFNQQKIISESALRYHSTKKRSMNNRTEYKWGWLVKENETTL